MEETCNELFGSQALLWLCQEVTSTIYYSDNILTGQAPGNNHNIQRIEHIYGIG